MTLFLQDDYDGLWNVVAFLLAFLCCVCQVNCINILHVASKIMHLQYLMFSFIAPSNTPFKLISLFFPTQCHLYLFHTCQKKLKSFTLLTIIILCNAFLFGLRNIWQLAFHMSVACLSTLLTLHRKLLDRNIDCGVWGFQLAVDKSRVRDQKMDETLHVTWWLMKTDTGFCFSFCFDLMSWSSDYFVSHG